MRYLDAATTRLALPMTEAITAMESAFGDDREVPVRSLLGSSLFMTGRVADMTGFKAVSTVAGSPFGIVAVFGPDGACTGIVDGPALTAIRTAAAAGLATRLLARPDARTLTILGAGTLAADQAAAIVEVRPIDDIVVWGRTRDRAEALAERIGGHVADHPDDAVHAADVVTTATPSTHPLFDPAVVRPGTHFNALGAFTPAMAEIPPLTLRRARVFVDDVAAAQAEAGDLLQASREPDGTLADLLSGRLRGRSGHDDITVFKSVGIASQDVAAASAALENAGRLGLGVVL